MLLALSGAALLVDAGVVIEHNPENETKADAQLRGQLMSRDNAEQVSLGYRTETIRAL